MSNYLQVTLSHLTARHIEVHEDVPGVWTMSTKSIVGMVCFLSPQLLLEVHVAPLIQIFSSRLLSPPMYGLSISASEILRPHQNALSWSES